MNEIDPVEFGRMVEAIENVVDRVEKLTTKVDCMSSQMTRGKGVIAGMLIAAGGIGAGVTHMFDRLLK